MQAVPRSRVALSGTAGPVSPPRPPWVHSRTLGGSSLRKNPLIPPAQAPCRSTWPVASWTPWSPAVSPIPRSRLGSNSSDSRRARPVARQERHAARLPRCSFGCSSEPEPVDPGHGSPRVSSSGSSGCAFLLPLRALPGVVPSTCLRRLFLARLRIASYDAKGTGSSFVPECFISMRRLPGYGTSLGAASGGCQAREGCCWPSKFSPRLIS